ncbi:OB-fold-containig protein [Pseudoalteromonas sp. MMG024]|uniref:OB-fold-containig protein n=1 Tax=Pseudoalteromonas sp. MMG024 TaxID=2909980 RepID=UPI001F483258|nr:OB-fold-containig protein [Pseudoalteromonas sp. MMG024]MCF6455754.1 DUF1449 family protein [Pseudoalteromonas sp. MMG024]
MDFLNTAFSFPSSIYTLLMVIVILFWSVTLIGFADIDMLEGDVDVDAEADVGGDSGWFQAAFGGVPLTISLSLVIMLSWMFSIYCQMFFSYLLGDGILFYVFGIFMLLASLIAAVPLTIVFLKPLKRFFKGHNTASRNDLLGLECTIATGKVTQSFGQARVFHNGAEHLIEVRCEHNNQFKSGDQAVLIEHQSSQHSYIIADKPW